MRLKASPEEFRVEEIPAFTLSPGPYTILRLRKRGRTTFSVLDELARALPTPKDDIGYAGLKDKHAITEQYISIPTHIYNNREVSLNGATLTTVGPSPEPITTGQLYGNRFAITVRDCTECRPQRSFVNYFGEQRFSENNAAVGKALVQEQYGRAVDLIRTAGGRNARLLREESGKPALEHLPSRMLTFYIHAYQSELWNRAARRLEGFKGSIPVPGFGTRFEHDRVEHVYEKILQEEDIACSDFIMDSWPDLSPEGTRRARLAKLHDLTITRHSTSTLQLEFFLNKGSYATVAVKQLCW